MRIAWVTDYYSVGMGYIENMVPKALAQMGHEVHVVTSDLNVYGTSPTYTEAYKDFLGAARQPIGEFEIDGYVVHRLTHRLVKRYVVMNGLTGKLKALRPEVIQTGTAVGFNAQAIAASLGGLDAPLFTACHQNLYDVSPHLQRLRANLRSILPRAWFYATRTLPGQMVARRTELCFAKAEEAAGIAERFYGVPADKIRILYLGTDTGLFHPVTSPQDQASRSQLRADLGFDEHDTVCIYTGRMHAAKKTLVLAEAVEALRARGLAFRALFIGDGADAARLRDFPHSVRLPMMRHCDLPQYYRAADVAVWPTQHTVSILDVAASGLPTLAGESLADDGVLKGISLFYRDGDAADMASKLMELAGTGLRQELGNAAREKAVSQLDWRSNAEARLLEYEKALNTRDRAHR